MSAQIDWLHKYSLNPLTDKYFMTNFSNYEEEDFKNIKYIIYKGYKNTQYIVTENGDIFHYIKEYGIVKKIHTWSCRGYRRAGMIDEYGKCHQFFVHRIVAFSFIPNPEGKPEVNHKDKNKENNHVSNLEWVTKSENERHKRLTYKTSEETKRKISEAQRGEKCKKSKKVLCVETGKTWACASDASRELGLSRNAIANAINYGYKTHGYHWQYLT